MAVEVPLDRSSDRGKAQEIMDEVVSSLEWNCWGKQAFVAIDRVGGEAMFFTAYAWITDRTQEPWYRGLLLNALVDALEAADVSVGQTTHLALGPGRDLDPSPPDRSAATPGGRIAQPVQRAQVWI